MSGMVLDLPEVLKNEYQKNLKQVGFPQLYFVMFMIEMFMFMCVSKAVEGIDYFISISLNSAFPDIKVGIVSISNVMLQIQYTCII